MTRNALISLFLSIIIVGCTVKSSKILEQPIVKNEVKKVYKYGNVYADNLFDGAGLYDFKQVDQNTYEAFIMPENTPINNSPWYSFRIWSNTSSRIKLNIVHPKKQLPRYIPKLSTDGINWEPSPKNEYKIDSTKGIISIDLNISNQKLWISAQEILDSKYISDWINTLSENDFITITSIGKSVLGRSLPLMHIQAKSPKYSLIFIGRQHPPEVPGGTMALMSFIDVILADTELARTFREKFEIFVFPLINPDGVDLGFWRHNAQGKDLNRDWVSFSQPETQAVKNWLSNPKNRTPNTEFCFGIDFHTSFTGPYVLTLDSIPQSVLPDITTKWFEKLGNITDEDLGIRMRSQALPYCYNWLINNFGIEAITYEEGDETDRKIVHQRARNFAKSLLEVLIEQYE